MMEAGSWSEARKGSWAKDLLDLQKLEKARQGDLSRASRRNQPWGHLGISPIKLISASRTTRI